MSAENNYTRAKLFAYLAKHHPGIIRIEVAYDGWGDEGWVDEVKFVDGNKPREGRHPRGLGHRHDAIQSASAKADADDDLQALVMDLWSDVFPGGDDSGGYGTVFIDPATQEVEVAHEWRSEEEFEEMLEDMEEEEVDEEEVDEEDK